MSLGVYDRQKEIAATTSIMKTPPSRGGQSS